MAAQTRFAKLVSQIKKRGGVSNPAAVAASIGRKKYGKEGFQKLAVAGRKKAAKKRATAKKGKTTRKGK